MLRKYPVANKLIYPIFALIIILFVYSGQRSAQIRTDRNNHTGLTNQAYNRLVACLASENPTKRTAEYTKECYQKAEKATGIKLDKFGTEAD